MILNGLKWNKGSSMKERIVAMSEHVAEEIISSGLSGVSGVSRTSSEDNDEDISLVNVDQALDTVLASFAVIRDNLPRIKVHGVPEKAAIDAIQDLFETALEPYLSDVLKAMQTFGG